MPIYEYLCEKCAHEFERDEAHWAYYGARYYADPYCPWYYPRFHLGYHYYH